MENFLTGERAWIGCQGDKVNSSQIATALSVARTWIETFEQYSQEPSELASFALIGIIIDTSDRNLNGCIKNQIITRYAVNKGA